MKPWIRRAVAGLALLGLGAVALLAVPTGCSNDQNAGDGGGCPAGQTMCGIKCTSVKEDPENCGACGSACPMFSICDLGACVGMSDAAPNDAGSEAAADAPASSDAPSDAMTADVADSPADSPADAPVDSAGDSPSGDAALD